jgi:hypothetical protein
VATKLGLLPLALNQAGSFISQRQISFQRYLALFDENFETTARGASNLPSGPQSKRTTVLTTWEVSFDALSYSAKELLLLCGFLANGDIPDELFDMDTKVRFGWMGEGKLRYPPFFDSPFLTLNREWLAHGLARPDLLILSSKAQSLG